MGKRWKRLWNARRTGKATKTWMLGDPIVKQKAELIRKNKEESATKAIKEEKEHKPKPLKLEPVINPEPIAEEVETPKKEVKKTTTTRRRRNYKSKKKSTAEKTKKKVNK